MRSGEAALSLIALSKSGLRLKALPTAGELAGTCAALPPLPEAEQLTADVLAPVSHVLAFNALLDVAWCRPNPPPSGLAAGAETVASPCDLGAGAKRQRLGTGESAPRSLPPSEVPGRRAEVLEGLRRVPRFMDQSPEEFWLKHGPAGPFPFPEQLAALTAERGGLFQRAAPSHGRV